MISFGCYEEQTLWLGVEGQSLVSFQAIGMARKNFNMSKLSEEKWPWHGWLWIIIKSASFLSILLNAFLSPLVSCIQARNKLNSPDSISCAWDSHPRTHTLHGSHLLDFLLCPIRQSHLVSRVSETGINWRNKLRPELIVKEITQGQLCWDSKPHFPALQPGIPDPLKSRRLMPS